MPLLVSQLAKRTGVRASTLRFYESIGLVNAGRAANGYRVYADDAVDRLAFIGTAKSLGLPLEEIQALLEVWESEPCAAVQERLRPMVEEKLDDARRQQRELSGFTHALEQALLDLERLPARDERCDPECAFRLRHSPNTPSATNGDGRLLPLTEARRLGHTCLLDPADLANRVQEWSAVLGLSPCTPIDGGLQISLPTATAPELVRLIADEQRCCPFFEFRLDFAGTGLHLRVQAPPGSAALVYELFGQTPPASTAGRP